MPNQKLSDECLSDFINAGISQSSIARICNMTRQAISARVLYKPKKSQIMLRRFSVWFLYRLGFLPEEIVVLTKYSYPTVYKICKAGVAQ